MKTRGLIIAMAAGVLILAIVIMFGLGNLSADEPDIRTVDQAEAEEPDDAAKDAAADDVDIIEGLKVTSDYRLEDIPNPFYRILEDPEEARERYELWAVDAVLKNENTDKDPTQYFVDYDEIIVYFNSLRVAPLDAPRIMMLFRKPGPDDDMIPGLVTRVVISGLETDDGLLRSRRLSPRERRRVDIVGFYTKKYSDFHHHKRTDEYDIEKHGPMRLQGSYGVSVHLSESAPLEYDSLIMGELYGLSFYTHYGDNEFDEGHVILRIPENVPRGMTAVFEIDVTQNQNYHEQLSKRYDEKADQERLSFRFKDDSIRQTGFSLGGIVQSADGRVQDQRISSSGSTSLGVENLGGSLIIYAESETISYMIYYIESLQSREITLPDDADIVVNPGDLVSFNLEVPYDKLTTTRSRQLWLNLLLEKESPGLYVASARSGPILDWDEEFRPESIPMKSIPGEFYVMGMGLGQGIIGRVVIREEDEGKTLRVLPLE